MRRNPAAVADKVRGLLRSNALVEAGFAVRELHAADLARMVERLGPEIGATAFALADETAAAKALEEMSVVAQRSIVDQTTAERLAAVVREMPTDDLVALLDVLQPDQAARVRAVTSQDALDGAARLMSYPRGSAGRVMTDRYVVLQGEMTAEQALTTVGPLSREALAANYIYLIDQEGKLTGALSLRQLVAADSAELISDLAATDLITAAPLEQADAVARLAMDYDLLAVPVVGGDGDLLGVVTIDDLFDVLDEAALRQLQGVVGGGGHGHAPVGGQSESPWARLRQRLPWLILLMFGDFLSANVIRGFEHVLEAVVAVAFFVPILLDMSGNVGTQSLALTIRGMSTRRITRRDLGRLVAREALTGVLLGLACGGIVAGLALVWQRSWLLGVVVGGAMFIGLTVAAILGVVIPFTLDRFGFDAAIGSSPLITTAADVSALMIYFLLATRWLDRLA